MGIVTIRDLLELLIYVYQCVKESIVREDLSNLTEKAFIFDFLEKNMTPANAMVQQDYSQKFKKSLKRIDSNLSLRADLSLIPKLF